MKDKIIYFTGFWLFNKPMTINMAITSFLRLFKGFLLNLKLNLTPCRTLYAHSLCVRCRGFSG